MDEKKLNLSSQFAGLTWLMHKYHQRGHHKLFGPGAAPHRGQGRVIKLLKIHPKINQKDLSYLLDIRPQSLGELLSKLEKNGYILRTPSETDKRAMIIELTEKGQELPEDTESDFDFSSVFDCLNAEEQVILSGYLERITKSLKENIKSENSDQDPRENGFDRFFTEKGMRRGFDFPPFGRPGPHHHKKNNDKK
ncbi:MarR family winged helix-turn-helix transcriptional regulator [Sebaldella sp. S0638]|uniref:MarR family winged helix-turn-helix transcriptional regulator n=1 Tax=Sebaldella sp. S0638 TaxID=2957809 RepID=UPI00209EB23F|nr:MarR family transcriptional regulator [Sebaldella sp. S0638]MCP1223153.1 MarR family transcriptional regulator [Sebaldella sp. S0638]